MFFSIANQHKDNFSHFYQLGPFKISTDAGWSELQQNNQHILYKGYADDDQLSQSLDSIVKQTEPVLLGNFCVLMFDSSTDTLKIKTDRYRSFPIYIESTSEVTNLTKLSHTAWTDSLVEINPDMSVNETKFDVIGAIDTAYTTVDEVVAKINKILETKAQKFVNVNNLTVKTFLTGGVDSLLVYSYLQRYTDNYEMVKCSHVDYDEFWLKNSGTLKTLWGYNQIHHWNAPCILTSGAPGDEFMLRSPVTVNLFLRLQDRNMVDLLKQEQWQGCLHDAYFNLSKNYATFADNKPLPGWNRQEMIWNLCNILVNDWQHWHIGNTLTWTPLRDVEIIKLLLRLPVDNALGQIMNSDISCQLIEQNKAGLTGVISDQKNSGNYMKNLVDFYFRTLDKAPQ